MMKSPEHDELPGQRAAGDHRFALLERALKRSGDQPEALIEVLHTAQETYGYLSEALLEHLARRLRLPLARVYGVATFYHLFSLKPLGEHACTVCLGTACYVKRSAEVLSALQARYRLEPGKTSADGRLSLAIARCLGSCGLAPVIVLDGEVVGRLSPEAVVAVVEARLEGAARPSPAPETATLGLPAQGTR
jgi:bidirectional [NiFe] hydrogenase diaphorase subunit